MVGATQTYAARIWRPIGPKLLAKGDTHDTRPVRRTSRVSLEAPVAGMFCAEAPPGPT
jgi:hypothetical protein